MYRVDNATAIAVMPTPGAVGPQPNAFFTVGDPNTALPATVVDADWLNSVQETLCYPIEQAGITLGKTDSTQLKTSMHVFAQKEKGVYATDTGSANAYAIAPTPAITSYVEGMRFSVKIAHTNTTGSTLNVSSLGAKTITDTSGNALTANALVAGMIADFRYDGTNFQLINTPLVTILDWATRAQVQSGTLVYSATSSSPNTYVATPSPALSGYTTGMEVRINFTNGNTGGATLNLNGLGAKNIKREDGSTLLSGDIPSGTIASMIYDGTNFRLTGTKVWQFGSSQSTNGYTKLPNGLLMQWGTATLPQNGLQRSTVAVTYPIAFPNAVFGITTQISGIINNQALIGTQATSVTTSGFTAQGDTPGIFTTGPYLVFWYAIGN